jgi:hypothetical protein
MKAPNVLRLLTRAISAEPPNRAATVRERSALLFTQTRAALPPATEPRPSGSGASPFSPKLSIAWIVLGALTLSAQEIKLPANLDQLMAKAKNVVDVTLDGPLLKLAGRFLSDKDPDEARAKRMVANLKGIYVRSLEFETPGEYQASDVDQIRAQLKSPAWTRVVGVRSKTEGENAEVFLKTDGSTIGGLVVLVADPKELTIVNIVGQIDPEDLRDLGGHFGVPKIELDPKGDTKGNNKKEDQP